jgi:hypothetical protein
MKKAILATTAVLISSSAALAQAVYVTPGYVEPAYVVPAPVLRGARDYGGGASYHRQTCASRYRRSTSVRLRSRGRSIALTLVTRSRTKYSVRMLMTQQQY